MTTHAFPHNATETRGDIPFLIRHPGMTLRDYFAASALQGILSEGWNQRNVDFDDTERVLARVAYRYADALLEERKGRTP